MTKDKNVLENPQFLDKILNYLIDDCKSYACTFDEIYLYLYSRDLTESNKQNSQGYYTMISKFNPIPNDDEEDFLSFSMSNNTEAEGEKLAEACYYLAHNNYIRLNTNFDIKLTFEGILKANNNFVFTYNEEHLNKTRLLNVENFQRKTTRWMLWVNGAIAVGTLVAMFYYILEIFSVHFFYCK